MYIKKINVEYRLAIRNERIGIIMETSDNDKYRIIIKKESERKGM
jgi:hypothetical protein